MRGVFQQLRNQFQVLVLLCSLLLLLLFFLSIPPSLPFPFSTDFISVTAACFPPLLCGAHGCPKQTVLTMGVLRVAVSLVPGFKIQSS